MPSEISGSCLFISPLWVARFRVVGFCILKQLFSHLHKLLLLQMELLLKLSFSGGHGTSPCLRTIPPLSFHRPGLFVAWNRITTDYRIIVLIRKYCVLILRREVVHALAHLARLVDSS